LAVEPVSARFAPLRDKLASGEKLRVTFVNDCGFIAGAGMAQRRQAVAFLAGGHDVSVVCSLQNEEPALSLRGRDLAGRFEGMDCLPELNGREGPVRNPEWITDRVAEAVAGTTPDLVIVGNLHWTGWPPSLPGALTDRGFATVCYLHDCYFITGRCVHPGPCPKFESGCDEACPTSDEYPPLDPSEIAGAHAMRRTQFAMPTGVPVGVNSRWTEDMARRGLGGQAQIGLVPLGLDESLFSPIDRAVARRMLGLGQRPTIVLFGATDMANQAKGGPFMRSVCEILKDDPGLVMCAFGHNSNFLKHAHGLGHVTDERVMPLLYAASDIYASFSREETFGQTAMEAAACGRPVVCRKSGGIVDIAVDGESASVVVPDEPERFAQAIRELVADPQRREEMGASGRRIVEAKHTMDASRLAMESWVSSLASSKA